MANDLMNNFVDKTFKRMIGGNAVDLKPILLSSLSG